MTWSAHKNILKKTLSKTNGLLSNLGYSTSQDLLITMHNAPFASHFSYGFQIWSKSKNQKKNEVFKFQKKSNRIITFKKELASAEPLVKEPKILPFYKMIAKLRSCPKSP